MCILYIMYCVKIGWVFFKSGHHTGNRQGKRIMFFRAEYVKKLAFVMHA